MPWAKLQLKPGINTQVSRFASEQTWVEGQLIRWFQGMLQKLGGWKRVIDQVVIGVARGIHAWEDLNSNPYLIIGTNEFVYVLDGGQLENITPIRATDNVAVDFSTVIGSAVITIIDAANGGDTGDWINAVTQVSVGGLIIYGYYQITVIDGNTYSIDASSLATATVAHGGAVASFHTTNTLATVSVTLNNHGLSAGSQFPVNVSTAVGGLTISGMYSVTSITNANVFVITAGSTASSTATASENGGNVRIVYLLPTGPSDPEALTGWGGGDWGSGDWGLDDGTNPSVIPIRQWFFSTWGEDAIGNPTNGTLYVWIPPYVTNPNMVAISGAPLYMTASFVAMPAQIAFALGAETGSVQDPNLIRWSDVADYNDWTPTVLNQAGSYRIPTGSHIVGGIQGPLQGLIWTDLDLWGAAYIGTPFIFGFTQLGQSCGLLCARGMAIQGSAVYWIGYKQFYYYANGGVNTLPCTVWDFVFNNLDYSRSDKVFAASNSLFNEISWYFPSLTGGGEIDSYVKVCLDPLLGPLWDYGFLVRTCWEDQSVLGPPVAVDGAGYIQQHETSNDADGAPLVCYAKSSYADLRNGEGIAFVDLMESTLSDVNSGTTLQITLYGQKSAPGPLLQKGPYSVTSQTAFVTTRMRARYIGVQVGTSDLASFWRLNTIRFRSSDDGNWQ